MKYRASRVTLLGLLFALSIVLSIVESSFSGLIPIPGIKPGLSNIVTMYCVFCLGGREAYTLAGLKALFALLTRGAVAAALSAAGGILSVTVMLLLFRGKKERFSPLFISICGGISHNAGQIVAAAVLTNEAVLYYFPVLAISGVVMGVITGILLRYMLPYFNKILRN